MAIDILKVDEEELLPTLGSGGWVIALPDDYPEFVVSAEWREDWLAEAAIKFVRWVIGGESVEIRHDGDPRWDHSGQTYRYRKDPLVLLTRYHTLREWFETEYTGNSTASFESGKGLNWDTYDKDIESSIDDEIFENLKSHLEAALDYDSDDDVWMDILDDVTWVQSAITHAVMVQIGRLSTKDAWQEFQTAARAQIALERKEAEDRAAHYRALRQTVHEFWDAHFADLSENYIDKPTFNALGIPARLLASLADSDPDIVEAIVEVGLPGTFSNSVALEIKAIAQKALK